MGENSKIAWTNHSFSPWVGCQRVSPGCEHCYAEAYDKRVGGVPKNQRANPKVAESRWGPKGRRVRTAAANWKKPLAWNKAAEGAGERHRVFCSSLADVFEDRPELGPWRFEMLDLIRKTPHLDWLLLTKRPQNVLRMLGDLDADAYAAAHIDDELVDWLESWIDGRPPANVWLGTTVEDQQRANERIPELLKVPAVVRFLSCEPLLERVELPRFCLCGCGKTVDQAFSTSRSSLNREQFEDGLRIGLGVNWVIVGGESGPGARPFAVDWARDLLRQCRSSGVAPFVKQLGARSTGFCRTGPADGHDDRDFCDLYESSESTFVCGAECRLRLTDPAGADPAEWPADLRVREFPR